MKEYRDIESGEIITSDQLQMEYAENTKNNPAEYINISFSDYVSNCMTYNGGTLEPVQKKTSAEFFKHFRRPSDFDDNDNPIFN